MYYYYLIFFSLDFSIVLFDLFSPSSLSNFPLRFLLLFLVFVFLFSSSFFPLLHFFAVFFCFLSAFSILLILVLTLYLFFFYFSFFFLSFPPFSSCFSSFPFRFLFSFFSCYFFFIFNLLSLLFFLSSCLPFSFFLLSWRLNKQGYKTALEVNTFENVNHDKVSKLHKRKQK